MAYFENQEPTSAPTTESDEPEGLESEETSENSMTLDPDGLLGRIATVAERIADVLSPFTELLTVIVQGATVWTLVRKA